MSAARSLFLACVAVAMLAGCAFMPRDYPRLEEAHRERAAIRDQASIARFAPAELRSADDVLERAGTARDTLDDSAVVDHLAYLARQRLAIARETARLRAPEFSQGSTP